MTRPLKSSRFTLEKQAIFRFQLGNDFSGSELIYFWFKMWCMNQNGTRFLLAEKRDEWADSRLMVQDWDKCVEVTVQLLFDSSASYLPSIGLCLFHTTPASVTSQDTREQERELYTGTWKRKNISTSSRWASHGAHVENLQPSVYLNGIHHSGYERI